MAKVTVGFEESHTNAPLVWAKENNLFRRKGLEIELQPKKYHPRRLNLFNALDIKQVDLVVAPFENAIERIACEYPITMIKQFARLEVKSKCFGIQKGSEIQNQSRFMGFRKTTFEFEFFAAQRQLAKTVVAEYFEIESSADASDALKNDPALILFSSNLSDHSTDIPPDFEVIEEQSNTSPISVVLAHKLSDGIFSTTSGIPHNEFVDVVNAFASAIAEAVEEIRESGDAVGELATRFSCSKNGLRKRFAEIEWVRGFEPALESTKNVTKVLTKAKLSPNCDFYDSAEFWKMPVKRRF